MQCLENGVLPESDYYFQSPSGLAKKLFYYAICAGEFYCDKSYHTKREHYNSILLIQMMSGTLVVQQQQKKERAKAGECLLINCYEPHEYWAEEEVQFRFLHFDGNASLEFWDTMESTHGLLIQTEQSEKIAQNLNVMLAHFRGEEALSEGWISCVIQELLCTLLATGTNVVLPEQKDSVLLPALELIHQAYDTDLTLQQMADAVPLSVYYFSRLFKKETGYSPYEYLLHVRLEKAKKLLKNSQKTIGEIGFLTGFQSESNFVYGFHKQVGMSPGQFRKLPF